ncbi:hypothetical protein BOS5A_110557 [Bosea sp. EC-HK365B]|nr:hypothetical protein BOSE21B_110152 [Bosea sp. 21B]CAD5282895.1 hypothetical protein BOSE7B_41062 [Bosea sp. 7B]VVT52104.1 hypothetical protein BOS5A_110557 [Bosea sp. EC-HK365B]VXC88820.1 hypothetical protein BOSE127_70105 [Bosea sp. 127]
MSSIIAYNTVLVSYASLMNYRTRDGAQSATMVTEAATKRHSPVRSAGRRRATKKGRVR